MTDGIGAALKAIVEQGGLLGALLLVCGLVIWHLWREGNRERRELLAVIAALQEARVKDATERETALTLAVEQSTKALEAMAEAAEKEADAVSELQTEISRRRR